MNKNRISLFRIGILFALVVGVIVLLFPNPMHGHGHGKGGRCAHNLQLLYKLGTVYAASHRGEWPTAKGEDFWLSLCRTKPSLIEDEWVEIFACPVRGESLNPGETDYLGPLIPWKDLKSTDPIAADKPGNHGPGEYINVLFKDGSVLEIGPDDSLWKKYSKVLGP